MNLEAPLFSISFGQSAVFLIGGQEKSDPGTPILLRSGDVLVMAKESRLCYHAVPCIFHGADEIWNKIEDEVTEEVRDDNINDSLDKDLWSKCLENDFWKPFNMYLSECRINLNVRQVLNKGQVVIN